MVENLHDTNVGNIEYIRREDAVDAVKHAWAKGIEPSQYIESLEPADVVPVVRCRDCEHDISSQFDTEARCNLWGCLKPKRGFCDAGKRREE